jgi:hypothetical protein
LKNISFYLFLCLIIFIGCKKEVLYTLNVSVTPSGSGTTSVTSGTYQAGQSVSITAAPSPEYIFKGWSGSTTSSNNPLTIIMDSSKSLVANFEKRQYPLSLTIEGSGVVKEEIVLTQAKVGSYPSGTTVKLTAIPDTGWKFDSWSGDTSLTVNPFTINFKKSYSIKAKFIEEPIKFSTNLDTGLYYVEDILPLKIDITSILPKTGATISVETINKDSNKVIFKNDTSIIGKSSITLNIPGHKLIGNYVANIKVTSKGNISNTISKVISFANIPILPTVDSKLFPDLNWNDVVAGRSSSYDIIAGKFTKAPNPPILYINDFTGKILYSFDLKQFKPTVRDSLSNVIYDYGDLNSDGKLDLVLTYMGEWWIGGTSPLDGGVARFIGMNSFLLINKGNMTFDVTEIIDKPDEVQFNVTIGDWDFDGKLDFLVSSMQDGIYYKNMGNNKFEKKTLAPLFRQAINLRGADFDNDGVNDFFNLYINQKDEFGNYSSTDLTQTLSVVSSKGINHFPVTGKIIEKNIYIGKNTLSAERFNIIDGDGDGDMDLIVGYILTENGSISFIQEYFENKGNSFVYKPNFIEIDKSLYGELQVWTKDIDKDGLVDLYYPTYVKGNLQGSKGAVFWWKNTKNGFKIIKTFRLKY